MGTRKRLPVFWCQLEEVESWLREQAEAGLRLVSFSGGLLPSAKFEPLKEGERVYYRVRYIPENREIGDAIFWDDLYIYQADSPEKLPPPRKEDRSAAENVLTGRELRWALLFALISGGAAVRNIMQHGIALGSVLTCIFALAMIVYAVALKTTFSGGKPAEASKVKTCEILRIACSVSAAVIILCFAQMVISSLL